MNGQKAQITTKDLSLVEELLDFQALAHAKAKTYCGYLQDQEAKEVMERLTQTHQQCFDAVSYTHLSARQRPWAVAMPIRSPVKLPGPAVTARAEREAFSVSVTSNRASIMGRSFSEWVNPRSRYISPNSFSS